MAFVSSDTQIYRTKIGKDIVVENDSLYEKRLNMIMENFEEPETIHKFIIKKIIPELPEKKFFMDIGAGKGDYTLPISEYFKHICIVEPNEIFCADLAKALLLSGKVVAVYKGIWEDFEETTGQKCNLIMCTNVLYYVLGKKKLIGAIQKMISCLASGGKLVIALASKNSPTALPLFKLFSGHNIPILPSFAEDVAECISDLGISYETTPLKSSISTRSFEDFTEVLALFTNGELEAQYIRNYASIIDRNFRTDNGYQIMQTGHLITLSG
jgi:SAM-dependent methyltransferase